MGLLGQDFVSRITGSAFADAADNVITAPEGQAIIAIQFLGTTQIDELIAKEPTRDINTASAANSTGSYTRTVNGAVSNAAKYIFDEENFVSKNDQILPGDEMFIQATGVSLGTVAALDPDGDNTKEIQMSGNGSASDDAVVVFKRQARLETLKNTGVGGMTIDTSNKFPSGLTIHGAWDSVSMSADDADGGMIVYFGQYKTTND